MIVFTTRPLTTPALAEDLRKFTGMDYLSFFDTASPIIVGDSINRNMVFLASRYKKGEARKTISTLSRGIMSNIISKIKGF
jgi:methylenetetrahydrofolate--tRNA-(uracil-5-)-methyltransferase